MAELRTGDGSALPPLPRRELDRVRRRLVLILELIRELEVERAEALAAEADDAIVRKITAPACPLHRRKLLRRARARGSLPLVRQSPYQSGGMDRDRSIGRAGKPTGAHDAHPARLWLRYQPGSALATWFRERVGILQGRTRRIAIVAMTRKLLIALLELHRDRRYTCRGGISDGDTRRGLGATGIAAEALPPAAIRGTRPSSSLVASCRRVSGGSSLTGATPRA